MYNKVNKSIPCGDILLYYKYQNMTSEAKEVDKNKLSQTLDSYHSLIKKMNRVWFLNMPNELFETLRNGLSAEISTIKNRWKEIENTEKQEPIKQREVLYFGALETLMEPLFGNLVDNGIQKDIYIHKNDEWREIVGANEWLILADFQKFVKALFEEQGKEFTLIEGTDVKALQENMKENMDNIDGFYNKHYDGGILYNVCLEKFWKPTGLVNDSWVHNWRGYFYFAVPHPSDKTKTLVLRVNENGWKLENWDDKKYGFIRPGLSKNA